MRGKVALITGASSGIGLATAGLFTDHGIRVAALGRSEDELQRAVQKLKHSGGEAIALVADISKVDEIQRAIQRLMGNWGRLDIVFANAGINGVWAPLHELSLEEWQHTLDINLTGTFLTLKYAVPHMQERGGAIVITASVNGTRMFSNSGASAYAVSKAGQVSLAKMLALELAEYGIRVNVICPGAIETEIRENTTFEAMEHVGWPAHYPEGDIPLTAGKAGSAMDVARLVYFLASTEASHITGSEVWIDGAQSLLRG